MDVHFAQGVGFHRVTLHGRFNGGVHALRRGGGKYRRDGSSHLIEIFFRQGLLKQSRAELALAECLYALIASCHSQQGLHAGQVYGRAHTAWGPWGIERGVCA